MRSVLILSILILFYSCAKSPADEVDEAIDIALTYLSDDKCDEAIDILEDVGRDKTNPIYLQVLASAYACRAGYNEVVFLDTDIAKINSADLMKSLTTLTLSNDHAADSDSYLDLREALEVVLYVDSNQPSQVKREAKYGPRKAGDMGVQALFLSFAQLGKFLQFYGNVDAAGVKGQGAVSTDEQGATASTCFVGYTEAQSLAFVVGGGGGACLNGTSSHPDMLFAPAATLIITKRRMCEGLMLITNIVDILDNLTLPTDTSMGDLSNVKTSIDTSISTITTNFPTLATLLGTTSQTTCETLVATAPTSEFDNLQFLYALIFEGGLQ